MWQVQALVVNPVCISFDIFLLSQLLYLRAYLNHTPSPPCVIYTPSVMTSLFNKPRRFNPLPFIYVIHNSHSNQMTIRLYSMIQLLHIHVRISDASGEHMQLLEMLMKHVVGRGCVPCIVIEQMGTWDGIIIVWVPG